MQASQLLNILFMVTLTEPFNVDRPTVSHLHLEEMHASVCDLSCTLNVVLFLSGFPPETK